MGSGPGLWGWQCHGQRDVEEGMVPPWAGGARGSLAGGLEGRDRSWEAGPRLCTGEEEGKDICTGAGPGGQHTPRPHSGHCLWD